MVVVTVALTVVAGPLYGITDRAADDLLDRAPYIDGGLRAEGGGPVSGRRRPGTAHRLRHQLPLLAGWCWSGSCSGGTWSWANLISGAWSRWSSRCCCPCRRWSAAPACPGPLLRFLGHFVGDLVVSGAQVAWQTIRPGGIRAARSSGADAHRL